MFFLRAVFFSSRRRHTRCALVTGVQTCALPIYPVTPPQVTVRFDAGVAMMKRQVSQAEYAACVSAGACKKLDGALRQAADPTLPVVGVSWLDATAYAAWLSKKTGGHYRLPTYAEWVYAAGPAYKSEEHTSELQSLMRI